jgi:tetratricopeptide (TPR) repeat protein
MVRGRPGPISEILRGALLVALAWAALLWPVAAIADQNDRRLDGLFERLHATPDAADARAIEQQIWQIWLESDDASVDRLMSQGVRAMRELQLDSALQAFDRLVEQAPEFAEAWNKRATVHYLMGHWRASVLDIQRTLALEPRHFGALFGLGLIYDALENPEAALRSYQATLDLNPHSESTRQRIEELRRHLQGRPT